MSVDRGENLGRTRFQTRNNAICIHSGDGGVFHAPGHNVGGIRRFRHRNEPCGILFFHRCRFRQRDPRSLDIAYSNVNLQPGVVIRFGGQLCGAVGNTGHGTVLVDRSNACVFNTPCYRIGTFIVVRCKQCSSNRLCLPDADFHLIRIKHNCDSRVRRHQCGFQRRFCRIDLFLSGTPIQNHIQRRLIGIGSGTFFFRRKPGNKHDQIILIGSVHVGLRAIRRIDNAHHLQAGRTHIPQILIGRIFSLRGRVTVSIISARPNQPFGRLSHITVVQITVRLCIILITGDHIITYFDLVAKLSRYPVITGTRGDFRDPCRLQQESTVARRVILLDRDDLVDFTSLPCQRHEYACRKNSVVLRTILLGNDLIIFDSRQFQRCHCTHGHQTNQ